MNNHQLPIDATPDQVNAYLQQWKTAGGDLNKISDGYHTFGELYDHRWLLFIVVGKQWVFHGLFSSCYDHEEDNIFFRSKKHHDGSEYEGWFLFGADASLADERLTPNQITYHLPNKYWDMCDFARTLEVGPKFDGHTSVDVTVRLEELIKSIPTNDILEELND